MISDIVPADYGPTHPEGNYLEDRRPELYQELVKMRAADRADASQALSRFCSG